MSDIALEHFQHFFRNKQSSHYAYYSSSSDRSRLLLVVAMILLENHLLSCMCEKHWDEIGDEYREFAMPLARTP